MSFKRWAGCGMFVFIEQPMSRGLEIEIRAAHLKPGTAGEGISEQLLAIKKVFLLCV